MTGEQKVPFRIALIMGLALFAAGCDREFCKRKMEIVPGIAWEYHAPLWEHYASRHSRIVSDKNGVIVEGEINEVHMTLHEYGFTVSGRDGQGGMKCVYVDLLRNELDENEATLVSLLGQNKFSSFEVTSAMGMYTKGSHRDYLAAMEALKRRVEAKLKQDGLHSL